MELDKDLIENLNEIKIFESEIYCPICQCILINPYKCTKCENSFCFTCITKWKQISNTCPFKCKDAEFTESKLIQQLLSKLKVKCPNNCGEILLYNNYILHLEEECPNVDYKTKVIKMKEQIEETRNKIQTIKNRFIMPGEKEILNSCQIKIKDHPHPLVLMQPTYRRCCTCDNCHLINFGKTYYCGLCDYDYCQLCMAKQNLTKKFFKDKTNDGNSIKNGCNNQ